MSLNFIKDGVCVCISWAMGCLRGVILNRKGTPNLNKRSYTWSTFSMTPSSLSSCYLFGKDTPDSSKQSRLPCSWLPWHSDCLSLRAHVIQHSVAIHLFIFPTRRWALLGQGPHLTRCVPWALHWPDSARYSQYLLIEYKNKWTALCLLH